MLHAFLNQIRINSVPLTSIRITLKKALAILMIASVMLPDLNKVGILIDFKLNQDFIAEVLCINREEPITVCNGVCYLTEQLEDAEEQEQKQMPNNNTKRSEVFYLLTKNSYDLGSTEQFDNRRIFTEWKNELYASSCISDIFHPPKFRLI